MKKTYRLLLLNMTLLYLINLQINITADISDKKIFTRDTVNDIATNKNNKYGMPNKYWNEETGEFTIPEEYTEIESFASSEEDNKGNIIIEKVKYINIPNNIKRIHKGAFGETYIKEIKWPRNVKTIEDYMFCYGCLEKIEIPDTVTSIGDGAFYNNYFTEVDIPDSVTKIGIGAFGYSIRMKKIKLPKSLKRITEEMLSATVMLEELEIPEGVREIQTEGISGSKIKEIKLPEGLTKLEDRAFWHNEKLEIVEMPGVTSMGNYVFSDCNKLKRLVVSQKFFKSKEISRKAFEAYVDVLWPGDEKGEGIKEGTVEVYVTDGLKGLNIEEIKATNRWIKNIEEKPKGKSEGSKESETKTILNTGLGEYVNSNIKMFDNI